MGIEFNHCLGASIYGEELKESIFDRIDDWLDTKNTFTPILVGAFALPIGVGLSLITLATKIATVGEVGFKAFANIGLGLIGMEGFNAKLGAKQLFVALPASIIDLIFGAPVHMAYNIIADSYGIALNAVAELTRRNMFGKVRNTLGQMIARVEYAFERYEWHERKIEQLEASKFMFSGGKFIEKSNPPSVPENFIEFLSGISCGISIVTVCSNTFIFGDIIEI